MPSDVALATANGYGLLADRPAAGNAGRKYFATDVQTEYRDNGATWDPISSGVIERPSDEDPSASIPGQLNIRLSNANPPADGPTGGFVTLNIESRGVALDPINVPFDATEQDVADLVDAALGGIGATAGGDGTTIIGDGIGPVTVFIPEGHGLLPITAFSVVDNTTGGTDVAIDQQDGTGGSDPETVDHLVGTLAIHRPTVWLKTGAGAPGIWAQLTFGGPA